MLLADDEYGLAVDIKIMMADDVSKCLGLSPVNLAIQRFFRGYRFYRAHQSQVLDVWTLRCCRSSHASQVELRLDNLTNNYRS